ncbi:LPXTG cell wall anchor domain-containing protein, partial [Streptococcus infantis]|uniref:LPXTG cell wall anchor domain-containing protein n=1 Tax=Streptococcus infantis TaxID=68892 RepID=UPI0039C318B9
DGTTTVTYPDGTTAVIPADKTVKKSADKVVTNPTVTPVVDPSNLTDAEKAKVADKVKKANPTASKVEVGNDGTATVTFPDGSVVVLTPTKTVKSADSNGVKNPSVTPVTDPSNLTDAEKAKVAEEVKKANPTATDIKVNNDGSVVVTFADGSVAVIASEKAVKEATKESAANQSAKKAGAKELPNTGTEQSNASLALALLAAATGGLLFAKKRKEEE